MLEGALITVQPQPSVSLLRHERVGGPAVRRPIWGLFPVFQELYLSSLPCLRDAWSLAVPCLVPCWSWPADLASWTCLDAEDLSGICWTLGRTWLLLVDLLCSPCLGAMGPSPCWEAPATLGSWLPFCGGAAPLQPPLHSSWMTSKHCRGLWPAYRGRSWPCRLLWHLCSHSGPYPSNPEWLNGDWARLWGLPIRRDLSWPPIQQILVAQWT